MTEIAASTDVVAVALSATRALALEDWSARDPEAMLAEMADLERAQAHLDAAKVALAEQIVNRAVAQRAGWADPQDFLTSVAGGQKGSGPGLVRLLTRLAELPATHAALAAGRISRAQAMVITSRIATLPRHSGLREAAEALLLEGAGHLDATDLGNSWSQVIATIDLDRSLAEAEQSQSKLERAAHHARLLRFGPDGYGGVRIRGYASQEDAEIVKAALEPLAAPAMTEPGACGGDPLAARARGAATWLPRPSVWSRRLGPSRARHSDVGRPGRGLPAPGDSGGAAQLPQRRSTVDRVDRPGPAGDQPGCPGSDSDGHAAGRSTPLRGCGAPAGLRR